MCEKSSKDLSRSLAALWRDLSRHLAASSDVTDLSKKFATLSTNSDRVDFVQEILSKLHLSAEFQKDGKSDEMATKLREMGNEMFKMKKVKEAWEFYTKSVAFAVENSPSLALAYANRSAVLFEVNRIEECLQDIDRALANNYPDHLKSKLVVRQKNSRNLQETSPKAPHEPLPELPTKNLLIASASASVEIQSSELLGRHVIATKDIQPGEIIAIEKPFTILTIQTLNHCHECIKLCYNLLPCQTCTQALYCSETCRSKAYENYHKHECPILATIKSLELDKLKMLPLKIAFLAANIEEDCRNEENLYKSNRYKEIDELVTNVEKRPVSDLFERAFGAAVMFDLVEKHTKFFENFRCQRQFKEILLLHMQTAPSNFHQISELAPNANGLYESEEIANGAFSFLSLLNHSCSPNVTRNFYGDVAVLRAIQSIKKGEQLFDNYGFHHASSTRSERQKQLKLQYYFDCVCVACIEDWPTYDHLPFVETLGETDSEVLEKLGAADFGVASSFLESALVKLKEAENYMPCKNFGQFQEVIKQCFAIFGNKRHLF